VILVKAVQQSGSSALSVDVAKRYARLKEIIGDLGGLVVGYSGGVDSTLLAKVAHDVLGDRAVIVTGDSEAFPKGEVDAALSVAADLGFEVVRVRTHEMNNERFRINNPDRCYHCKTELFGVLHHVAEQRGVRWIADGSNADDVNDHRPGMRAAEEIGVLSPLREAGMTKADIRVVARHLGVPNWDKPSFACLSSRFPYGTEITPELLERVDRCEQTLRDLGFRQFRVRHHDTVCRIEVEAADISRVVELREVITARFREAGYLYVTVDLEGFRSGKMNDVLNGRPAVVRMDAVRVERSAAKVGA
jgi:pyridinium-3,5-biscarboxylic acid mononucleotide sulfurtransferase